MWGRPARPKPAPYRWVMLALAELAQVAAGVVAGNARWMLWNLALALVPLALALILFEPGRTRTRWWWAGVATFVAFLPNAPYVLTDVIHLYSDVRSVRSDAVVSLAVIPQYALFFAAGAVAYVACLWSLRRYAGDRVPHAEVTLHALCAVGIYVGRFERLNSWDLLSQPGRLLDGLGSLLAVRSMVVVLVTFAILWVIGRGGRWTIAFVQSAWRNRPTGLSGPNAAI